MDQLLDGPADPHHPPDRHAGDWLAVVNALGLDRPRIPQQP